MTIVAQKTSIKAIAFDWGGVLCEDPAPGFLRQLAERFHCTPEALAPHLAVSMEDFQRGLVSEERFLAELARKLNRPENKAPFWKDAFRSIYKEQTAVHNMIRALRGRGYAIGFISNTEMPAREFHAECNYDFFDALIFSCEEGIAKPEKEIYDLMALRLGVSNNELLLVDDKMENIAGAKAAGAFGILYENPAQLAAELERHGVA